MNIAKVQSIRKLALTALVLVAVVACAVTASKHTVGGPTHETIEWIGIVLMFVCIAGRSWTSLYIGGRKITQFVTIGPYSVTRNPLYFFSVLGAVGAGAQFGSFISSAFAGVTVWTVFYVVILREERVLADRYGDEFRSYKARVARFIPNPRLWRDIPTMLVMPSRALRTFADGMFLLLSIPVAESIERLQHLGILPVLFRMS